MRRSLRWVPLLLVAASLAPLWLERAETVPLYAARTGNQCQTCHFDPNGGGPRNDFGFNFARNRHSLDQEPEGSPWRDLTLTNRVGENMPLYIGTNQRFMVFTNDAGDPKGVDRFGFFNMENAISLTFKPHEKLTLVYVHDSFASQPNATDQTRDAFGMLSGGPWSTYLKAGRFRNPFGLRLDDHTVATRNAFLDFAGGETFLPYDPRYPDMGVEIGTLQTNWFGRASFTNGSEDIFQGGHAQTSAAKIGYNNAAFQSGVSFYDAFNRVTFAPIKRGTRWGYYGLTHRGPFALLGEVAAGTDEAQPPPGFASGAKRNSLAWYAELDYAPVRYVNVRGRYDYLVHDHSTDDAVREANTHSRYALEAEWVPVPFCEIRGAVRRIDHKDDDGYSAIVGQAIKDETQAFLQFHFSY